ncbi:MAG: hypothetical protein JST40_02165 [Armatimonadetes bacterium]|nr:hypothetical protein [Armatimonadota bacterium]
MNIDQEIQKLREEMPRPEAKGELIRTIQYRHQEKHTLKTIGKIGIPVALVAGAAMAATFFFAPTRALATPATVAKAIRSARDYVIRSFSIQGGKRTLISQTNVDGEKATRTYFDAEGKPVPESELPNISTNPLEGALIKLEGDEHSGQKHIVVTDSNGPEPKAGQQTIEVKVTRDQNGNEVRKYVVNGKEVDKLPAELEGKVHVNQSAGGQIEVEVNGSKEGSRSVTRKQASTVMVDKNGKITSFSSGKTTVEYLLKLLDDADRWNIERKVTFNGEQLDKFTLKGPFSPIELYVDPSTSLPKVLRFNAPMNGKSAAQIEDVYEYGTDTIPAR